MRKSGRKPIALALTAVVMLTTLIGCQTPEQTPNLPATIAVAMETQLAAIPTATPYPTNTPVPTPEPPTATPNLPATIVRLIDDRLVAMPTNTPAPTANVLPTVEHAITSRLSEIATPDISGMIRAEVETAVTNRMREMTTGVGPAAPLWIIHQGSMIGKELNCAPNSLSDWTIQLPNNFRIDRESQCDEIIFDESYEDRTIGIGYIHTPELSQDPATALEQISQGLAPEFTAVYTGEYFNNEDTDIEIINIGETNHQGTKAISIQSKMTFRILKKPLQCYQETVFIPSKGWASHNNRQIYIINAITCLQNENGLTPELQQALASFTEIVPFIQ